MLPGLLLIAAAPDPKVPAPPYKRVATSIVFASAYEPDYTVLGNRFFAASGTCEAYDLKTLKKLWSVKVPKEERIDRIAAAGNAVYATTESYRDVSAHLMALDPSTGKVLWSVPRKGAASAVRVSGNTLYTSLAPYELAALDLRTRKVKWRKKLAGGSSDELDQGEIEAIEASGNRLVAHASSTAFGVDATTGKILWKEPRSYLFQKSLPISNGIAWVPRTKVRLPVI